MNIIEIKGITRSYTTGEETVQVLKGIDLTIEEGEFVAIMGPSGSGKSTLMQILGLLDRPTSGTYRLLGRDVSRLSDDEGAALRLKTIGFVFQMFNLLGRTSAFDNVALPLVYAHHPRRDERVRELLAEVGLSDRMEHKPNQLSGGQQQRVAIARALVNHPRIIFADEPTGNLASEQAEGILAQLKSLNRAGITVIMVTHEPDIAAHAGRILQLKDGLVISDERNAAAEDGRSDTAAAPTPAKRRGAAHIESSYPGLAGLWENLLSALRALTANKVRSVLSILGILIGVAAVIAMLAIGQGAKKSIEARLASMGSNLIMLSPNSRNFRGVKSAGASRLTMEDAIAVGKIAGISDLYPENEENVQVAYGNKNTKTELQGVTSRYEAIRNAHPYSGRFFTDAEDTDMAKVVLLGQTVVHDVFGDEDPVGQKVKINRIYFKVIGILPIKGGAGGGDQDDMVVVPINTAMRILIGTRYLHEMAIECPSPEAMPGVMAEIAKLIRSRHHLPSYKDDDFNLRNMAEMQATLSSTTQTLSLLLGIVAAISLVVGGVGIMNIMLVSVNERVREIGLRKAVGATRRTILLQFLIEAAALSMTGGVLGVASGVGASLLLSSLAGWAVAVTSQSIVLAFVFSVGTGLIFGFWPARRASLLSPIEALRYE
jgi:macrolide transport system ATP-binding/permease protein